MIGPIIRENRKYILPTVCLSLLVIELMKYFSVRFQPLSFRLCLDSFSPPLSALSRENFTQKYRS